MRCEDDNVLLRFERGELPPADRERVLEHLADCEACRLVVASLADTSSLEGVTTNPARPHPRRTGNSQPDLGYGRYHVKQLLGRGGMGVVHEAWDVQLRRRVALKVLRDTRTLEPEDTERFLREAQLMAQLKHPNVVTVYDAGWAPNGQFFIAMELVEGTTLRRWLQRERPPWRVVVETWRAAGRGLAAIHAAGLAHRDFKPDNVLMGADGVPRVTDLGLAGLLGDAPTEPATPTPRPDGITHRLTVTGTIMGSSGYLAPELTTGARATAASDQFSFCVSLYEALFGARPFGGATLEAIAANAREGRFSDRPNPTGAPAWVTDLLVRGLSADPARRHPSLQVLLDRLGDDPVPRRRRRLLGAFGVASFAVMVGVGATLYSTACDGAGRALDPVWSPDRSAAVGAALRSTGFPFAAAVERSLRGQLDGWADRWRAASRRTCVGALPFGDLSQRQAELQRACLLERREELDSFVTTLLAPDRERVLNAPGAFERLHPLEACLDLVVLENPRRVVAGDRREAVRRLRQSLASAHVASLTGRSAEAVEQVQPVLDEARRSGVTGLAAEAALVLGRALQRQGDARCLEVWEGGLVDALAAVEDDLALRLVTELMAERGYLRGAAAEARALRPIADGLVNRRAVSGTDLALLLEAQANVDWGAEAYESALHAYRRALGLLSGDSLDAARLHASLAWTLSDLGRLEEGRAELALARAIAERLVGGDHPALIEVERTCGQLQSMAESLEAAARCQERVVTLLSREVPPDSPRLAAPYSNLGSTLSALGRTAEAREALERAERASGTRTKSQQAGLAYRWALLLLEAGDARQAVKRAQEAVSLAESEGPSATLSQARLVLARALVGAAMASEALAVARHGTEHDGLDVRAEFLALEGEAQLRLGRTADATRTLEAAISAWFPELLPARLAQAWLALAEARWQLGQQGPAREAASQALQLLTRADHPRARQAEAWLEAHR